MDEKIKKILHDIYNLDESLKSREDELVKIIQILLESKPDTKFDNAFKHSLKNNLDKIVLDMKEKESNKGFNLNFLKIKKWRYFFSGAMVAVLLMVVGVNVLNTYHKNNLPRGGVAFLSKKDGLKNNILKQKVKPLSKGAFGELNIKAQGESKHGIVYSSQDSPQVFSGAGAEKEIMKKTIEETSLSNIDESGLIGDKLPIQRENFEKGINPDKVDLSLINTEVKEEAIDDGSDAVMPMLVNKKNNFKYEYRGESINIENLDLPVYKKVQTNLFENEINDLLSYLDLDLIDFYAISSPLIGSIEIVSDILFGYIFKIDFINKVINIIEYEKKWNMLNNEKSDNNNYQALDIRKKEDYFQIADQFLDKYKIDKSSYASPMLVNNENNEEDFLKNYEQPIVSLKYPLLIDGYQIIDYYGQKKGMYVNIDQENKRVLSVYDIDFNDYLSSKYDLEKDFNEVLQKALEGGINNFENYSDNKDMVVYLNAPKIVYSVLNQEKYKDYLFPCYAFLVETNDDSIYHEKYVIVPLIKDYYK